MVTMSGRGTITSRTTVSPNSMIEWMRARSSVSMTSPSTATSAMASSSDSVTAEPRYCPCSPMSRLARPMRPPDTIRTGQKRTRAETSGALNRAARSGWCTAQFFGHRLAEHEDDHDLEDGGRRPPPRPRTSWAARMPTRVATTSWQISTSSSTGLRNPWGFSVSRTSTLAPRRPSSTRAMALARLIRTRLVSARASRAEAASSTTTTTEQHHVAGGEGAGGRSARRGRAVTRPRGSSGSSSCCSRRSIRSASSSTSWSMPSRWRMPCTTSRAISSSKVTPCSTALRAATAGQITTSPSRSSRPVSASMDAGSGATLVGRSPAAVRPRPRWGRRGRRSGPACRGTARSARRWSASSTNSSETSVSLDDPLGLQHRRASCAHRSTATGWSACSSAA